MASANLSVKKRAPKMGSLKRNAVRVRAGGLVIDPVFCPTDVSDPFDTVEWECAHRGHQG